ncbi:MAG: RNB domain-containing ribonuclease [Treponema sp.]|nr:RNB domain-containing ribonuclease [Treponema sp.]
MIQNSLVLYKTQPAVIKDVDGDKYILTYCSQPATPTGKKAVYSEQKVREKDVVLLEEGPVSSVDKILAAAQDENLTQKFNSSLLETYELLISEPETAATPLSFSELTDYAAPDLVPDNAWSFYQTILNMPNFCQDPEAFKNGTLSFTLRTQAQIDEINQKKYEKEHEAELRQAFINRLKNRKLDLPGDSKFMGEVEAFALCQTDKSKVLEQAGIPQNIEKAHRLLIETGIWSETKNPHPTRLGFSFDSAREQLGPMPDEEREEVPCICYAIDSPNAADPDDAIGYDGEYYWVCIADPASSVAPDSSIDIAARNRGTTLYIPEGASRMLCEKSLEDYALGLKVPSCALAFRLKMNDDCQIEECVVKKVRVNVKMISYAEVEQQKDSETFKPFYELARRNLARRTANNAVTIQMPEVDIHVDRETKIVTVEPEKKYESNDVVQEFMLLAGEGAARFAFANKIAFPFVSQEAPEFPAKIPDGWAGQFARVKCMRKRSVGITPAPHAGLGLSFYSQVTSPLRRYSDLIAHQQLRAFIDGRRLLDKDEMLERIAAGDAASLAARKASRLSETHWKLVYLMQNPEKAYTGFCIDKRGNDALFLIPELDMQTTLAGCSDIKLNDEIILKSSKVDITTQNVIFMRAGVAGGV